MGIFSLGRCVFFGQGHLRLQLSYIQVNTVLILHIILPVYFSVHHVNKKYIDDKSIKFKKIAVHNLG